MAYLLDTHYVIWAFTLPHSLKTHIRSIMEDSSHKIYVSSISAAEISIKTSIGKLNTPGDLLERLKVSDFKELPFSINHANTLRNLPLHHRDPFDRMLVAQAIAEDLTLITCDESLKAYGSKLLC